MAEIEIKEAFLDEMQEFVKEKWKHVECEVCGNENWGIYPETIAYVYLPIGSENAPPQVLPPPARGVLAVSCQTCGNIRLFDAEILKRWRAEAKATKSSS